MTHWIFSKRGAAICTVFMFASTACAKSDKAVPLANPQARIVVDQFGYLPAMEKIAVLRDPKIGFDAGQSYAPGGTLSLVSVQSGNIVMSGPPVIWRGGQTDPSSGDKAWTFDFSAITTPGTYHIIDAQNDIRSHPFEIKDNVYRPILKEAVRNLFYQRAGHEKRPPFIAAPWADGASHLQDRQARLHSDPDNAALTRDVHGGWYDAGDYNQYTSWTANYIVTLMQTYLEQPEIFTDDFNIPESGNGVPDLLDEVKWGLDWLMRMQNADGSTHSILGRAESSPPSAAKGPSFYGDVNTSSTLTTAAAFAISARVFEARREPQLRAYGRELRARAIKAWDWARANPNVIFKNNDEASGSGGLGAGQQEVDDAKREEKRMRAAIYLFALTGDRSYERAAKPLIARAEFMKNGWVNPFHAEAIHDLLFYAALPKADRPLARAIRTAFSKGMFNDHMYPAIANRDDPYGAHLGTYTWGSNSIKSRKGAVLSHPVMQGDDTLSRAGPLNAGAHYIHYIHGVNPLGLVYLSNMQSFGAEHSVDQLYHAWFKHGDANYDSVSGSTYGPLPGYLVGGANPTYNRDQCCPSSCGPDGNALCKTAPVTPPYGQPDQKSYGQFNESWPHNSWEVTENSLGYQTAYIQLLARYVD